jgi:hypothetical protein
MFSFAKYSDSVKLRRHRIRDHTANLLMRGLRIFALAASFVALGQLAALADDGLELGTVANRLDGHGTDIRGDWENE